METTVALRLVERYSKAVGGVTPSAVIVIAVFLSLTAVAAAVVDERGGVGDGHFDLWRIFEDESCGRFVQFEDTVKG